MSTLNAFRAILLVACLLAPSEVAAQGSAQAGSRGTTVVLASHDGSVQVEGVLVGFDGQVYRLQTPVGPVEIAAKNVHCMGAGCPLPLMASVRIAGSSTLGRDLLPALIDAYSLAIGADMSLGAPRRSGGYTLTLTRGDGAALAEIGMHTTDTTSGFRALSDGVAEIALASRPATERESRGTAAGEEATILALDGLLVVTAPGNPVRALSIEQIADVFAGRIRNWSELGGDRAPINLYGRTEGSGSDAVFDQLVMRPHERDAARAMLRMPTDAAVSDTVRDDPNGIGITSFAALRGAQALSIRMRCGLMVPANRFTIKTEEYPLTRRLYAYRAARVDSIAANFLSYATSPEAQRVVTRTGFVDQSISGIAANEMGLRWVSAVMARDAAEALPGLQELMEDLVAADRLSLTFRFQAGSSDLDLRGQGDLTRLARLIRAGTFQGRELMLIGFTDSVGDAKANRELSQTRAEHVARALSDLVPPGEGHTTQVTPMGFGELTPLACDETESGRQINRRVEVWVRNAQP